LRFGEKSISKTAEAPGFLQSWSETAKDYRVFVFFEQLFVNATKSDPVLSDAQSTQDDYTSVRQIIDCWKIIPRKLPFEKFVVSCLGVTSSGKSSWVNHV
jgi:hypothetical protein